MVSQRCRSEFVQALLEDLRWLGIHWIEGPNVGGPFVRIRKVSGASFIVLLGRRCESEVIYPCTCSRKEVAQAVATPNDGDDEPVYPGRCRPEKVCRRLLGFGFTRQPRRLSLRELRRAE